MKADMQAYARAADNKGEDEVKREGRSISDTHCTSANQQQLPVLRRFQIPLPSLLKFSQRNGAQSESKPEQNTGYNCKPHHHWN
jgi:hypothetical protein